ncbi:Chromosome (plasmid) partitioning protein ParA [Candidatus Syntrophocurvum alkaliphilum]|uniref:Sporulation initiation inhibitor protein Soj n=1 Tax=Candidatus Syntrophocurvum alkaliphilum TaxID=2293317 RepID=A0A6I6DNY9_9FIRM|nr:AAA family ATPase [Candidatus Syntrophocurvum alkaliphilum]QGU00618.1 Chromosome (plasmid) partitioning protein ParA [Candidatus Syntrophocurvum alkaliphilum]
MAKIIAVTNQKGGVGKTTTAINLSACVAMKGHKVLLIDNDPQGNATSGVGVNRRKLKACLYDVLLGEETASKAIIKTKVKNLDLLPSTIQLAGAEVELTGTKRREKALDRSIELIENKYDYIFIDCPPSLGLLTVNALTAANTVMIPLQCEYYALEGLSQLMDTIALVRKKLNRSLNIEGIVFTMFDGRTNLSIQVVDEVKKHFRKEVYKTIIPRNIRLSEAPSHGKPIVAYDSRSRGAEVYWDLSEEVLNRSEK